MCTIFSSLCIEITYLWVVKSHKFIVPKNSCLLYYTYGICFDESY